MCYSSFQLPARSVSGRFFYTYSTTIKKRNYRMKKVKEVIGLNTQEMASQDTEAKTETDTSYLARRAGMQTVQTSMRGLLGLSNDSLTRKTLLGE